MALTISELKTLTIEEDLTDICADITDAQFVYLLNQVLILKQAELKKDVSSTFEKTATLTVSSAYDLSLPADIDPDKSKTFRIYNDTNRVSAVDPTQYRNFGGAIRFNYAQAIGKIFPIEYQARPNTYSSATMSTSVAETASTRASMYIRNEIRKLFYDSLQQNEQSSAGVNYGSISNRIS